MKWYVAIFNLYKVLCVLVCHVLWVEDGHFYIMGKDKHFYIKGGGVDYDDVDKEMDGLERIQHYCKQALRQS